MLMTPYVLVLMFLAFFVMEVLAQRGWIGYMKRLKVTQVQKSYGPGVDVDIKGHVPSMGGMVFLLLGTGMFISGLLTQDPAVVVLWLYPLLAGLVGFADDWIKYHHSSSEGFSSKAKFVVQLVVTIAWLVSLYLADLVPFAGWFTAPLVSWPLALFFAVGLQNAVNVTDGLDGLAAGTSFITFIALAILVSLIGGERTAAVTAAVLGAAICLGFLWHNSHPAQVFMGDGGAHFLAGLMFAIVCVGNISLFHLIPLSFLFGVEMLSVVIQLIAIHGYGRKVFLMSPLHHHFQLLGWKETKITIRFWILHLLGLISCYTLYGAVVLFLSR